MQPADHTLPRCALKSQINQSEDSQLELLSAQIPSHYISVANSAGQKCPSKGKVWCFSDKVGNVNAVDEVPHVAGQLNNDLYAVPVKRRSQPPAVVADLTAQSPDTDTESGLPSGWEKHEDNDGPYYWHIKSGTIQREPPALPAPGKTESRRLLVKEAESVSTHCPPRTCLWALRGTRRRNIFG
uniref:(California timema) hypothetical protein n=1 Tax=Timema californicum TaxID=61474 RepID=A0A7R9PFE4_TIMCA|nr:unnamed protein product [Timema californicum]